MNNDPWMPVTRRQLIGFSVGLAGFFAMIFMSQPGFVFGLDHANLLFHEAGHPIIGLFSNRLEPYGGTIGQLVFPIALAISFWRKKQPLSFAASLIWFFQNWWNIARYMADARAMQLPLVGGGDHDWNTILTRWNILQYDARIAEILKVSGWIGVGLTVGWVLWRFYQSRHESTEENNFILL